MAGSDRPHRVAVVQHPPVLLDRAATLERAAGLIAEAAGEGASLVTFPEAFVPGYPEWIWRLKPGDDHELTSEIHGRLMEQAVDLDRGDLRRLQHGSRQYGVTVVVGIHELDAAFSRGTLYNTVVVIGPDGSVRNRHRKLVPTNPERMVWGPGDASGLRVIDTEAGRLGSLICWENYMPLARFALYAQGVQVYVAPTWDMGEGWAATMVHIAREGRCWVIGNGQSLQGRDIPDSFPERARLFPDPAEWINDGDSVVVNPGGEIVAGPLHRAHGILYAECDPQVAAAAHHTMDVAGHFGRPDLFRLEINRAPLSPITYEGEAAAPDGLRDVRAQARPESPARST